MKFDRLDHYRLGQRVGYWTVKNNILFPHYTDAGALDLGMDALGLAPTEMGTPIDPERLEARIEQLCGSASPYTQWILI